MRLEALYRSGRTAETIALAQAGEQGAPGSWPAAVVYARTLLADGQNEKACAAINNKYEGSARLPAQLAAEALMARALCAARSGDVSNLSLTIELAREQGLSGSFALAALEALESSATPKAPAKARPPGTLDVALWELAHEKSGSTPDFNSTTLSTMSPPALIALANTQGFPSDLRLEAAFAATKRSGLSPEGLTATIQRITSQDSQPRRSSPLWQAWTALASAQPGRDTARAIVALVAAAESAGMYETGLGLAVDALKSVRTDPAADVLGETAIEAAITTGREDVAAAWIDETATPLSPWTVLSEIAFPTRNADARARILNLAEKLAVAGRFEPDTLHILASSLDALGYLTPIPLWNAASAATQPTGGHLPETGVLSRLKAASGEARQTGATGPVILLALDAIGPEGPAGTNLLALSDTIRALKAAGLEAEARRIAVEALLPRWPRGRQRS